MNFAILIVGVVLFSATNIDGLIENTKSFKCKFSSCCHNAQKPSNYSHVKIEYTVNFTSESAYLTILSMNQEEKNNIIYRVSNITSAEPGNHTLKTRDNFIYCFFQVKNQSELSNKKIPFFYSFGYEFDEDSFKAETQQIQGQLEEKRKIEEEIKENVKNITKEEEIKIGEKSIEIKEQVGSKNITEEKIETAEKDKLDKSIKIEDEQIKIKENTKNITKEEEIKIEEKSIEIKEQVESKNITEEKIEIAEKDKLDKSIKIEDEQIKIKENTKNITEEKIKIDEKQELEKSIEIKNNDKQENNNNEEDKKIKNQDFGIKSSQEKLTSDNCTKIQEETFKKEEIKETFKKEEIKEEKKKNQDIFSLGYLVKIWEKAWSMRKG
ncbi:hypothetical protein HCN44_002785 [Aphidius gifuensis]|uniref:Odorant-binding protein n=1 Tax=Aphidius gifuensis TaxID=684658 RepID=A0A834XRH2_APHGI|nr:hypothetical protein HCN44_002785 [Aphidius gifuensis]